MKNFLLACSLIIFTAGCSERHRSADTGRSPEELEELVSKLSAGSTALDSETASAVKMAQDDSSTIYFAESNNKGTATMGPLNAVADVDWDVFGLNIRQTDIENIRIYFVE